MEEQRLVVIKEEERTENGGRDPFIVQVRTIGDSLTGAGPSHIKMESQEEIHQRWDFQWQEFLKRVAALPAALPPLDDDARGFPVPWGRIKENPPEESSGEARGESVLQRDPNISGKAWMDREKLDFCMKVKVEESLEEVDLGSQWPLQLRQFGPQDAEQHQEVSNPQRPKKGEEWGTQNPEDPQPSTSYASGSDVPENTDNYEYFQGFISNLMLTECDGYGTTHKKKTFQVGRSEEIDFGRFH
ncbi:hypothetical protein L345_07542, partial [Ophiophagus hannah]